MIKINLKKLLKEKNMTMTELHLRTGITQKALSLISNGKNNSIHFNTLEKIVKELDCTMDELISIQNEPYRVSVNLLKFEDNIYTFSLNATNSEGMISKVVFGFELTKSKSKNRNYFIISFYGRDSIKTGDLNDSLFVDSILDYSNKTISKELLKVFSYLIAHQILKNINDVDFNLQSLVIFTWKGLIQGDNEEIYKIHIESKGNDAFPAKNTEATAKVNFEKLLELDNVIESNESSILMFLD